MKPFLPALGLFLLIVATAPAISHIRDFIFESFPRNGVRFLLGGFFVVAAGFFLFALVQIRTHRFLRYGALLFVLALLWVQTVGLATDQINVDAVEKLHVLEYGTLAFLIYRALLARKGHTGDLSILVLTLLGVTLAGTLDEWVQWLVPRRTGDIRDVALNATAGLSGVLFALALQPPERWSWHLEDRYRRRLLRVAAVTVLVLGLFFYTAHLGYRIEDPEIGQFLSRFTQHELRELAAQRKEAWSKNPPTDLKTWAVEDYFLTEAARHATHRNASYRGQNFTWAWLANRVLEKYYDPFLDIHSFRGSGRHRYGPGLRSELEKKKGHHNPATYLSPVLTNRIYPWPKPLYLTGLAVLVTLLWLPSIRRRRRSSPSGDSEPEGER